MKKISRGTYIFSELREHGWVYVDKTAWLHRLVADASDRFFFLSRPRRFGKSLMLSTLQSIFEGRRDLFEGLAIAGTDYDWKPYRVLRFDFSGLATDSLEAFEEDLFLKVSDSVCDAGLGRIPDNRRTAGQVFEYALRELCRAYGPLAALVDEYDAPISHALTRDAALAEEIRASLARFYIKLKEYAGNLRFLMLTGVSKFNQASVFSALNNITDLSMRADFADMLGYTEEELTANFAEHMQAHAAKMGLSYEAYRTELRRWYDGYRFSPDSPVRVYNPVAIAQTLTEMAPGFRPTWTTTGSTSLLIHLISRRQLLEISPETRIRAVADDVGAVADLNAIPAPSLLFQTGYLTIVGTEPASDAFFLGLPNEEVRRSYETFYLNQLTRHTDSFWQRELTDCFERGEPDAAFPLLKDLYAGLAYGPNEPVHEANYRRLLMILFHVRERRAEEPNAAGNRSDLLLDLPRVTYVFEFKQVAGATAETAIGQIKDRGYAAPYLHGGKPVWAVGLAFDPQTHMLCDAKALRLTD